MKKKRQKRNDQQKLNKKTKKKQNSDDNNEIASSIFGSTGGALSASIFGTPTKTSTNDLFGNPEQFNKAANELKDKNLSSLKEHKDGVQETYTDLEIRKKRQDRLDSDESKDLINEITLSVPDLSDTTSLDEEDKEDVIRSKINIFSVQCDRIMRENGVVIIESNQNMIENKIMKSLTKSAAEIEHDIVTKLREKGHTFEGEQADESTNFKYHEVASRCLGRLDIRYKMDCDPFDQEEVKCNKYLMPVVKSLLGRDAELVYAGLILSFPGSADQPWHQDGHQLFSDEEFSVNQSLPPYALNVFVPLDDVDVEVGPTEFCVQSHTRKKAIEIMKRIEKGDETGTNMVGPLLKTGDALIYDYRVCHRGVKNISEAKTRPMLYLMYARPWFKEHINFSTEKLFTNRL